MDSHGESHGIPLLKFSKDVAIKAHRSHPMP